MQTRYSSLVKLKKSTMQKSERVVQKANADLNSAAIALQLSYESLKEVEPPTTGNMSDFLASRTLLNSQRGLIEHNNEWLNYAQNQVKIAKEQLKSDMIDFEKFQYLEYQEIKKHIAEIKAKEAKELDEVALMTYSQNQKKED